MGSWLWISDLISDHDRVVIAGKPPLSPPQDNRKGSAIALPFLCNYRESLLFGENFVYFVIGHHFFLEHIGSGLGRFHNFNHLRIGTALTFLKRCDGFLCHGSLLFNFFVNGYSSQNGVVFFQLQTLSGVFSVFGGNITRHAGQTTIFLFGAFENYLYSITFSFLCHLSINYAFKYPFSAACFNAASNPTLLMRRSPAAEIFKLIQQSCSTQ